MEGIAQLLTQWQSITDRPPESLTTLHENLTPHSHKSVQHVLMCCTAIKNALRNTLKLKVSRNVNWNISSTKLDQWRALPFLRLFFGISWATAETKHCSTLAGSSESYSPCTWNGRTHLVLRFVYLVWGSRVYEVVSLCRFSGVVWPSSLYIDSLSARTSSGVACPLPQLLTAQQASKELKKPRAQPDPVGQKGWNKTLKHQSTHAVTPSEPHLFIYMLLRQTAERTDQLIPLFFGGGCVICSLYSSQYTVCYPYSTYCN